MNLFKAFCFFFLVNVLLIKIITVTFIVKKHSHSGGEYPTEGRGRWFDFFNSDEKFPPSSPTIPLLSWFPTGYGTYQSVSTIPVYVTYPAFTRLTTKTLWLQIQTKIQANGSNSSDH